MSAGRDPAVSDLRMTRREDNASVEEGDRHVSYGYSLIATIAGKK